MYQEELLYLLALQKAPAIGDISAKKLVAKCGSAKQVFYEKKQNLLLIDGIGEKLLSNLDEGKLLPLAEQELNFINRQKIGFWVFNDDNYPERLKHCIDGPILLFNTGNIDLSNNRIISIVGTRNLTNYGRYFCEKLVEELKEVSPVIVSGFAYGTDICAQAAAIKNNLQTIGCLAHGLNQIYPKAHKKYINNVEQYGGFVSDFWSSDNLDRNNFLKRNRIIAGLSEATIVIESGKKGGSLVTADIANSYNREVFAVPGRINDPQSEGCNDLIKNQRAQLINSAQDVIDYLNWDIVRPSKNKVVQPELFIELNSEETIVTQILKENEKIHLDELSIKSSLPIYKLSSMLLNLELKGLVRALPGKQFQLIV